MSEKIKTDHDGWDCVPQLKGAVKKMESLRYLTYEINNCVRQHDLSHIVEEMKQQLEEAIEQLETIDTTQEFETVDWEDL